MINWCARVFSRRMAEALRPLGLTPAYLPPLLTLAALDGATQSDLAKAVEIQQPTMALTLDRMERDGLITRVRDTADQRRVTIRLSPKAEELVPEVAAIASRINAAAFQGLPADVPAQLIEWLSVAAHNLQT